MAEGRGDIAANPRIVSLIVTMAWSSANATAASCCPVVRVSIPPAPAARAPVVPLDRELVEKYAATGWIDLRVSNFEKWKERLSGIDSPRRTLRFGRST